MASSSFTSHNGARDEIYGSRASESVIMPGVDLYAELGISPSASFEAIKRAYRHCARECHPDRNGGDGASAERFRRVQHAYQVLTDPQRRRVYDLARGHRSTPFPPGPGARWVSPVEEPGREATIDVTLPFGDAMRGGHTHVANRAGELVRVTVPRGCRDGTTVRVKGRSGDGDGDLLVRFHVEAHPRYRREGNHLHVIERITAMEAMLGTVRSIATPYGRSIRVTIPAGTQPGERLRLRGLGVQTARGAGDLFVEVDVQVPKELSDEQREQLRDAARTLGLL